MPFPSNRSFWLIPVLALLAACSTPQQQAAAPQSDPTTEPWYSEVLAQVTTLNRMAEVQAGERKNDEAAATLKKIEPLVHRLLSVPSPTLEAVAAASDADQLHARMLLANRHYGWARMLFQKDAARWRNREPQTEETVRRRKVAEAGMVECDKAIAMQ